MLVFIQKSLALAGLFFVLSLFSHTPYLCKVIFIGSLANRQIDKLTMEPKYKVNPLTGELQEYVFEYNGILALRNFTARVEDERLILHAADDVNFSILEALVSELEINGVVYDNPTAAQEALTRLTFNQNRPVLLDKTLKDLILGAVQKIPGKKLTTEDFTTELRQKLEGLQRVDTSGLLPKGGYTGTAQDLKNLIDAINRILQSDDTQLDQLQEIVTYIKQNKHILSTLGISNIAGLVEALAAKADKNHHHDERYAAKTHTHNEYALRTHRHNWDDIDGKPNNLATTENIKTAIDGIQIGGRNYIVGSNVVINSAYNQTMRMSNELIAILNSVRLVTVSVYIEYSKLIALGRGRLGYEIVITYTDNSKHYVHAWKPVSEADLGGSYAGRFSLTHALHNGKTIQSITSTGLHIQCTAENVKLGLPKVEIGNKPTDWSPAPEDFVRTEDLMRKITRTGYETSTSIVVPQAQQNDTIFVNASCTLGLQNIEHLGSVSFIKTFDTGAVTFTCAGKTIIMKGDTQFNGGKGSTAVVSIHNNDCYIRISNV